MASPEDDDIELKTPDNPTKDDANHASATDEPKKGFWMARQGSSFKTAVNALMIGKYIERTFKMKQKTGEVVTEVPTDCYGDIYFKETTKRSTGKFVRISDETNAKQLFDFMTNIEPNNGWGIEKPRLLISVTGGAKSFTIDPRLKKDFQDGLAKVASTPGAWVVSGGTSTGVMKIVGDANYGTENICIGIATWGTISEKDSLTHTEGKPRRYDYHLGSYLVENNSAFLDYNHSHFLLVDDGTEGKYGGEIEFRGKFEDLISKANVPTILLVLNGGFGTLRTVYNTSVINKIPCVLIKGSGGISDLLAYALMFEEEIKQSKEEDKHEGLIKEIKHVAKEGDVDSWYALVLKCLEASKIFTVSEFEFGMDTDDAVLTALLLDKKSSPSHYEQIRLTIIWDRADLADSKVLAPLLKWEPEQGRTEEEEFNKLMIMALAMNRKDFVKLLLDYGVSVKKTLTKQVLEFLYYCQGHSLKRADITAAPMKDNEPQEYKEFFIDLLSYRAVGAVHVGGREENVEFYRLEQVRDRLCEMLERAPESDIKNLLEMTTTEGAFEDPFRQLFIWAVMSNLLDMALFFWEFLDDAIAMALIASEIIHVMMEDTRFKELNGTGEGSLQEAYNTFSRLAIDLMDSCHKANEEETEIIVTNRLHIFNEKSSCLEFAIATGQEDFVAQPAIQGLLDEVWYGSIKATDTSLYMVFATIICPFLLLKMDIRSKDEINEMNENNNGGHTNKTPDRKHCVVAKKRKAKYQHLRKEESVDLSFWEKFVNFHLYSPVVRFFEHTVGYLLFLMLITYMSMLKKTSTQLGWAEIVVAVTVFGFFVQELYQIFQVDMYASLKCRLVGYLWDIWNLFDLLCIIIFIIALILRCHRETVGISHFFYGADASLWIVRLIRVLYVDTVSGPYVVMIGQMIGDMFKFLIILLIFLLSYGVGSKAFLNPSGDNAQMFVQTIFHPYFHIHGEYFLDEPSNGTTMLGTPKTNNWQEPIALLYMGVYLLITNILLLNLLIAIFNNTYERVISNSSRIWKFKRYALVVEYAERRTFLCSPFSLIQHIGIFLWFLLSKCCPCFEGPTQDSGLKQRTKLEPDRQLYLRDFERCCCIQTMKKREEEHENVAKVDISVAGRGVMKRDELEDKLTNLEQKLSDLLEEIRQERREKYT